mgnify:CR=1 FL=1
MGLGKVHNGGEARLVEGLPIRFRHPCREDSLGISWALGFPVEHRVATDAAMPSKRLDGRQEPSLVLAYGHRDDRGSSGSAAKDARDLRLHLIRIIVVGIEKNQHYTIITNANALHSDCTNQPPIQHLGPGKAIWMLHMKVEHLVSLANSSNEDRSPDFSVALNYRTHSDSHRDTASSGSG